jgi:hypothetical protein
VVFSPDGKLLASCSGADGVLLWDVATGKVTATLKNANGSCENSNLAFSPDGTLLASGICAGYRAVPTPVKGANAPASTQFCIKGGIRLWDVATGQERTVLTGHYDRVRSVAFSPNGALLASGSCKVPATTPKGAYYCATGEIRLWNVGTGKLQGTLVGHADTVWSLAFNPDGTVLASGSCGQVKQQTDGSMSCTAAEILLWGLPGGRLLTSVESGQPAPVSSLAFSPDGTRLAAGFSLSSAPQIWAAAKPGVSVDGADAQTYVPEEWLATYVRPLRYTVNIGQPAFREIGRCAYTHGHTLIRRVATIAVTITDVKTKRQVAALTFSGNVPNCCPYVRGFISLTEYSDGPYPSADIIANWIKNTLSSFGAR